MFRGSNISKHPTVRRGAGSTPALNLPRRTRGLPSLPRHSTAAYISSTVSCERDRDTEECIVQLMYQRGKQRGRRQSLCIKPVVFIKADKNEDVMAGLSAAEACVLQAISAKHASDWPLVAPSPGLSFKYAPDEFQCLLQVRLLLALPSKVICALLVIRLRWIL